jgi:hypothetical protein
MALQELDGRRARKPSGSYRVIEGASQNPMTIRINGGTRGYARDEDLASAARSMRAATDIVCPENRTAPAKNIPETQPRGGDGSDEKAENFMATKHFHFETKMSLRNDLPSPYFVTTVNDDGVGLGSG